MLCLLSAMSLWAQNSKLFGSESKLSNSLINQVFQDHLGYIWICTEDGLNRFDGLRMKTYLHQPGDSTSLTANYIQCIYEDASGTIYVGSIDGLLRYNAGTDDFLRISLIDGLPVQPHVKGMVRTQDGSLWVATSGRGLMCLNPKDRSVRQVPLIEGRSDDIFVSAVAVDNKDNLWLSVQGEGIFTLNTVTGMVRRVPTPTDAGFFDGATIAADSRGNIFAGSAAGLMRYDDDSRSFAAIDYGTTQPVSALCICDGYLYIGTDGSGASRMRIADRRVEPLRIFSSEFDPAKAKVHSIIFDKDNNLWLGIFQKGVMMIPHSTSTFVNYGYRPDSRYNIGSCSVQGICSDGPTVWIGTDNDGLYHMDDDGRTISHFADEAPPTVYDILPDGSRHLLLASYTDGLVRIDRATGRCTRLNRQLFDAYPQFNKCVVALARACGDLWVATYGCGAFAIAPDGTVRHYMSTTEIPDNRRNELRNNWVNCIEADSAGYIWFGTYKGASRLDPRTGTFDESRLLEQTMADRVVFDILCDSRGNVWFATSAGIVVLSPDGRSIRRIDQQNRLPGNSVMALAEDHGGMIWATTLHGLSRINPNTLAIRNFYSHDGVQNNEYSRRSAHVAADGRLYFGGVKGVSAFYPEMVENKNAALNVTITHFYLYDKEQRQGDTSHGHTVMNRAATECDTFCLSYYDKAFSFEFSTFDYANTDHTYYEVMLQGFSNEWISTKPGQNTVWFTNLQPGTYALFVRATNGQATGPVRQATVVIMPAWFQTWWAMSVYALIFAGIVALMLFILRQQMRLRNEQLNRHHEMQINEAKFQFFFNISHEIRTPLTLIINPISKLLEQSSTDEQRAAYTTIHRNAQRILRLMNQLLDIRKIDKGQMTMHFATVDIVAFVTDIKQQFDDMAHSKHIGISITANADAYEVDIDPNNFDKVIYNVLSNALKFTPDNGSVKIEIFCTPERTNISVADTGIGIDDSQAEKIFNRFYQIESSQSAQYKGTGIGLHLSRSIVDMHGGTITARRRPQGQGSLFCISLPTRHPGATPAPAPAPAPEAHAEPLPVEQTPQAPAQRQTRPRTNYQLLVVEDETEVNNYLVRELSAICRVSSCTNGRDAYNRLLRQPADIVVSDVMMPEMDGITLCHKIKTNHNISHIPVILLTAKVGEDDKNTGIATGADAYIEKPFSIDLLRTTITTILANRERLRYKLAGNQEREQQIKPITIKSADEQLMEKVMKYLNDNISDSSLSVESMAEGIGLSRVHLHRKLKALTGMSARDFIRTHRLEQAGRLLQSKKLNISDVAYTTGFSNLSHFSNTFKDFYGMTPSEYMQAKGVRPDSSADAPTD